MIAPPRRPSFGVRARETNGAATKADVPGVRAIAGVLLLYLAGALVGSRLTLTPEGVALLWPSNAVLLSALLRWEGRRWWAVAAVGLVAEVIADVPFFPLRESLVFGSVNVLETGLTFLMLRASGFDPRFSRVADVGRFVIAGPLVGALLGALGGVYLQGLVSPRASSYLDAVQLWWFGDGLGLLIFTPLYLGFWLPGPTVSAPLPSRPAVDVGMALLGLGQLALLAWVPGGIFFGMHLRPVLLLPPVLYFATRLPFRWACAAAAAVALVMVALVTHGRGPYGGYPTQLAVAWTQEFVLVLGVLTPGLAALLTNLRIGEEALAQANRELRNRAEALERSNAGLRRIAYVTAHDLQTPLRSISCFAALLRERLRETDDDQREDWIRRVTENVRRLETMLREIGRVSAVEARAVPLAPVRLDRLLDRVLRDLEGTIRGTGATVTRGDLPEVWGDAELLAGLLKELVCNALKFHGPRPPRVSIAARDVPGEWEIAVHDEGVGVPPELQERVFELFYRAPNARDVPGTGAGLAYCARVVQRHGGRIWMESRPGAGCTVRFTLPRGEPGR